MPARSGFFCFSATALWLFAKIAVWCFGRMDCAMRESDIDQAERRAVLENDRRVLEQRRGSTLHQHGMSQAAELSGGRFAAVGSPTVIASRAGVAAMYPAASSAHQTELPPEQPLGYSIDDMPALEPSADLSAVENPADSSSVFSSAEPGGAPPPAPPERVAAPPSSPLGGPAAPEEFPHFPASAPRAGPPSSAPDGECGDG